MFGRDNTALQGAAVFENSDLAGIDSAVKELVTAPGPTSSEDNTALQGTAQFDTGESMHSLTQVRACRA